MSADKEFSRVSKAAKESRGLRSNMFVWMERRYEAMAKDIALNGPRWKARAEVLAELGVVDGSGNPPTEVTARTTWSRVASKMRRKRPRVSPVDEPLPPSRYIPPLQPGEIAPGVRPVAAEPPPAAAVPPPQHPPSPRIDLPRVRPMIDLGPAVPKPPRKEGV